jgi:hypothetical protein
MKNSTARLCETQDPFINSWLENAPKHHAPFALSGYLKKNESNIENALKTLSVSKLSELLHISYDSLKYQLNMLGIDVKEIKDNYARSTIKILSTSHSYKEIKKITGFSANKILKYRRELGFLSI